MVSKSVQTHCPGITLLSCLGYQYVYALQAVMCGLFGRTHTGVKKMTPTMHAAWLVEDAVHGLPLVLHGPETLESVRHSFLI